MKEISYSELQRILKLYMAEEDVEYIHSVYLFTRRAHEGQFRKSGESYIIHPIAVAIILAKQSMPVEVIVSGLLHDVVEDTEYTLDDIEELVSKEVADIVDGVTKLGDIQGYSLDAQQAENHRKLLLAAAKDIRVLFVKLADRLHNMQTIKYMNENKQKLIANETMEVYAPIAHRLGMYKIKWELEDLSFKVLNPNSYTEIASKLSMKKDNRDKIVNEEVGDLQKLFEDSKIDVKISGRSKHIYSIYRKMEIKHKVFEEITDLFAFRIIVDTIPECYTVLGILHENYKPIPMKFKDYIPTPKHNMYQSIHTTVIGKDGLQMEFQIRTKQMDEIAEYGIASHWSYKESKNNPQIQQEASEKLTWLRKAIELDNEAIDSLEFMSRLKDDHFSKSIFVYTPKGEVIELPDEATVLDFAFYIHSELGYKALSAKVNDKIVSLSYKLAIGDVVSVITSEVAKPEVEWIAKVRTTRAKEALKKYFKNDQKRVLQNEGRRLLIEYITSNKEPDLVKFIDSDDFYVVFNHFDIGSKEEFFYEIGVGDISPEEIVKVYKRKKRLKNKTPLQDLIIEDVQMPYEYRYCKYCSPIPEDEIKAIRSLNKYTPNMYYIHRKECYQPYETKEAYWTNQMPEHKYRLRLEIDMKDQIGAVKNIIDEVAKRDIGITSIYARGGINGVGICRITIEVQSDKQYREVKKNMLENEVIYKVVRRLDKEEEWS